MIAHGFDPNSIDGDANRFLRFESDRCSVEWVDGAMWCVVVRYPNSDEHRVKLYVPFGQKSPVLEGAIEHLVETRSPDFDGLSVYAARKVGAR